MTKSQLKQLTDYIKDLAERLVEWDYDHIAMQTELPKIYETIKLLMDEIELVVEKKQNTRLSLLGTCYV